MPIKIKKYFVAISNVEVDLDSEFDVVLVAKFTDFGAPNVRAVVTELVLKRNCGTPISAESELGS